MPQPTQKSKEGVEWPERIPMGDMQRMVTGTSSQLIDIIMQPPYVERYGNLVRDDQAVMDAIGELNRRVQNGTELSAEQKQNLRTALFNLNIGNMSAEEARSVTELRDSLSNFGRSLAPAAEEMPAARQQQIVFTEQAIKTIESPPYVENDGMMVVDRDAVLRAIGSLHQAMEDGTLRLSGDQASRLWWAIANMRVSSMPADEVPMAVELRDYASSATARPQGGRMFGQE